MFNKDSGGPSEGPREAGKAPPGGGPPRIGPLALGAGADPPLNSWPQYIAPALGT